jgi:hypothetical protein
MPWPLEGAADAGEEAAVHGGAQADQQHRVAHGARRISAFAGGTDQETPARRLEGPIEQRRNGDADQE